MIHTVKPGETLHQIARDYRIPIQMIINANPSVNPNVTYPGQSIIILGFPPANTLPYQIDISVDNRQLVLLKDSVQQKEYPIAVGRVRHGTPVGSYIVINKAPNLVRCG